MMPTSRPRIDLDPAEAGYTLLELLVVIAIVGLLASLAAPRLSQARNFGERPRLIAEVAEHLRAARSQAMSMGTTIAMGADTLATRRGNRTLQFEGSTTRILFYPDGSASGGVVLADGSPLLAVDWLTGMPMDATPGVPNDG